MHGEQQERNLNMPSCCAGERCKLPSLGLGSGIKSCPNGGEKIHDVCAVEAEEAGLSERNDCPVTLAASDLC